MIFTKIGCSLVNFMKSKVYHHIWTTLSQSLKIMNCFPSTGSSVTFFWSDISASAKFSSFDADELSRCKDFIQIGAGNFAHFSWTYIDEHISLKVCFQYNYRLHFSDNLHAFVDYFSSVNCVAFFLFQAVYMLMALSLARDEFHWLLRHADNNVPTRKANTKTHSEDFVDR